MKYNVTLTAYLYRLVEADSEEEALKKAEAIAMDDTSEVVGIDIPSEDQDIENGVEEIEDHPFNPVTDPHILSVLKENDHEPYCLDCGYTRVTDTVEVHTS